jgi:hypothetical protein
MFDFGLEPGNMEKIQAVGFPATWISTMVVRIAGSKEGAAEGDKDDDASYKVYTEGSRIDGCIGASAVLYKNGTEVAALRRYLGKAEDHRE